MIIHASLKTDIAQFYSEWIINRLKTGFIDIQSEKYVERYDLKTNKLSKIYFWSKDPQLLIKKLKELLSLPYDFEIVTEISLYDKCYEPKIKSKQRIMEDIRKTSKLIGKNKISLCYGPVFTTFNCSEDWHLFQFKFLCEQLHESINKVYIAYEISDNCLNAKNYNIKKIPILKQGELFKEFKKIAENFNLQIELKPESKYLTKEELDIGDMNSCPACCMYCIGVNNKRTVKIKNEKHNPKSSLLIGNLDYDSKIKEINIYEKSKKEKEPNFVSLFDNFA